MGSANTIPKKFLVPTDFSESADHAMNYAADLAKALGASIVLLHAYEVPLLPAPGAAAALAPETIQRIISAAEDALRDRAGALRDRGIETEVTLKTGDARQTILAVAGLFHAELIVMGTHGRTGFSRLLIGSVAENVVRSAAIPVLTVKPLK